MSYQKKLGSVFKKATFASLLSMLSCSLFADTKQNAEIYIKEGTAIIDMVNTGSINLAEVESKVLLLLQQAVPLAYAYGDAHPNGKQYLQVVIDEAAKESGKGNVTALGPMVDQTFDHLEVFWHDAGFAEVKDIGIDMSDEDNEHFNDPMHAIVHPVMVLRAARDYSSNNDPNALAAMKSEMEEGIEQVQLLINEL